MSPLLTAWEVMLSDPEARAAWEKAVAADARSATSWDEEFARAPAEPAEEARARRHHRAEAIRPLTDGLVRRLRDGNLLALAFVGDGIERAPIPPAAWEGNCLTIYIDPEQAVGRLGDGRMVTGLRFRWAAPAAAPMAAQAAPAATPAAPSRPARGRPRRGKDDLSPAEGRAAYLAWCRRINHDPRDLKAPSPSWKMVWSEFRGMIKRETIRAIHQDVWGPRASEKGRKSGPA